MTPKTSSKKGVSTKKGASAKPAALAKALRSETPVTELTLQEEKLSKLPRDLAHLTELRELNLRGNRLRSLDATLAHLEKLEGLDLVANDITEVHPDNARLRLRRLQLGGNHAKLEAFEPLWSNETLEQLSIQSMTLGSLPDSLATQGSIVSLGLTICQLASFPSELGRMPKLRDLHLSSSRLGELPSALEGFQALRLLDLSSTEITRLPRAFCQLPLEELWLGDHSTIELDDALGELRHLKTFRFNNVYKPLPAVIARLTSLEHLCISNNSCRERVAPIWLADLTELQTLDVTNNDDLQEIPDEVLSLPKLHTIYCFNTPLSKGRAAQTIKKRFPHLKLRSR